MEIEYADIDTDTTDTPPLAEADAASVVNGDGMGEQPAPQQTTDEYFEELREIAEGNQEVAPTLDDDEAIYQANVTKFEAIYAHDQEVSDAKEEHFSLAVKRSELENELKEIKADEKAALKNLKNLIKRGPSYPVPPSKIEEAVATGGERSAIVVDDPTADTTWRNIPTADILTGIKGMGDKKAEAIISLAPTLGDLEELRARAGLAHKPFATVLPKGVGGGMADEIEERVLSAVAKHMAGLAAVQGEAVGVVESATENCAEKTESATDESN